MNNNETLRSAMEVMDSFYKNTAIMLETFKGILVNDYGYNDIGGNRVCWECSRSISYPLYWIPPYLSLWFQNKVEKNVYISITITLKEYWKGGIPKEEYFIYGCKYKDVVNPQKDYPWIGKDTVENPDDGITREVIDDFTEVEWKEYFGSGKFIKRSLWDMKDRQAVADFAKQVTEL